jgi:hypothetical protein
MDSDYITTQKWIEVESGFLLLIKGIIFGEDQDIIFYDLSDVLIDETIVTVTMVTDGYFQFSCLKNYLEKIYNSYKREETNIIKQFQIDFHRQDYFINDQRCTSIDNYFDFVNSIASPILPTSLAKRWVKSEKSKEYQVDIVKQHFDVLILMLSTQASFAHIVESFSNYYPGLHLVNSGDKPCVMIRGLNGKCVMEMRLHRYLFNLETEKNIKELYCSIHIDFSNLCANCPMFLLSWTTF